MNITTKERSILDPAVVLPDDGTSYTLPDQTANFLLRRAQTGHFALAHFQVAPGGGVPTHIHEREHETWIVTRGTFRFGVGGSEVVVGPGAVVFGPQGVPHSFANVGAEPGEFYIVFSSDNFEAFFGEFVRTPTAETLAEYGLTMLGAPAGA